MNPSLPSASVPATLTRAMRTVLLVGFLFCFFTPHANVLAQHSARIVFLHLHATRDSVTLIEASVRPGTLKRFGDEREDAGKMKCVVETKEGAVLFTTITDDPLIGRYEYPRNDHGDLATYIEHREEADFWIRVPFIDGMHAVAFSRIEPSPDVSSLQPRSIFLGRSAIKLENGAKR